MKNISINPNATRIHCLAVLFCVLANSAPVSSADGIADILAKVYSTYTVTFDPDKNTGSLTGGEKSTPFEVNQPQKIGPEGQESILFVVTFKSDREARLEEFLKTGKVAPPGIREIIVVAPLSNLESIAWKEIDSKAFGVVSRLLQAGDFIGNGSTQIQLEATCTFPVTDPKELIQARRYYLYSFPELRELFAATTGRIVANEQKKVALDYREVRFSGRVADGTRRIELYEPVGKKTEVIPFKNGRFEYELRDPTARDEISKRKRTLLPKLLRIQVMDSEGNPIPNAKILGSISWVRSVGWKEMSEKISATTDAEGYFEQYTPDNVGITIMKDGYYTTRKFWSHEDITNDPITVTLQPENLRVPMYRGTIKLRDPEITEFGIRFVQVETVSENVALVRSKGSADLWVELYRNGNANNGSGPVDNNAVWHARVTGRKGWNLLPELDEMSKMREAPIDAAYEQVLEFSFNEFPKKIYLRQGDGDSARYGKLTTILRHDANEYMTAHVCAMGYAVQASPVGNNSLNPVQEVSRR